MVKKKKYADDSEWKANKAARLLSGSAQRRKMILVELRRGIKGKQ